MDWLEGILYMMWRGIAIGILVSAPMGPVGILCIQRTLDKGRREGFFTGCGAAISDLFYCLLTGFGLSFIEEFLERNKDVIQLAGSAVLIAFAIYLFKKNPAQNLKTPSAGRASAKRSILTGFLFTVSNPLILFLIIGLFARFNFSLPEIKFYHYMVGFLFIFIGAIGWWWIVTFFIDKVRAHFNLRSMWLINRIIGTIILLFAVVGIATGILSLSEKSQAAAPAPGFLIPVESQSPGDLPEPSLCGTLYNDADTVKTIWIPLAAPSDYGSFRLRVADLTRPSAPPAFSDSSVFSRQGRWALTVGFPSTQSLAFFPYTGEWAPDPLSSRVVTRIEAMQYQDEGLCLPLGSFDLADGIDHFKGPNSFRLDWADETLTLRAGHRSYESVAALPLSGQSPHRVGIRLNPGACVEVSCVSLEGRPDSTLPLQVSMHPDSIAAAVARSKDSIAGYWTLLDRSCDESRLKCGGQYTLAILPSAHNYAMYYISGAETLAAKWQPGQPKGELRPSSVPGIFDVTWIDASGLPLSHEIKASAQASIITFNFPYHNSSLRLHKVKI